MNRRKFLKFLGIGAAAPTIIAKAITKPVPLIAPFWGAWDGVLIIENELVENWIEGNEESLTLGDIETTPPKEIAFSPLVKADAMFRVREMLADHYLKEFDKTMIGLLNG